ncbi:MAG: TonB-dependent receptor [Bacteroidetes bacterium]|nr:TonB-dependent receptor [Bacteroidota bacterium]
MKRHFLILSIFLLLAVTLSGQTISGKVNDVNGEALTNVEIIIGGDFYVVNKKGEFSIEELATGDYVLNFFKEGYKTVVQQVSLASEDVYLEITLEALNKDLDEVLIEGKSEKTHGFTTLKAVEGVSIYAAKKSEVIVLDDLVVNKSSNNARQIFARISGANIWESDCAGLQIGVASRGLSPNRNANFNTRQNGYDISADPLGYPESYYTPALQAVERVEVVRGASSLQYGTQFGGMVNFKMKQGAKDKVVGFTTHQSYNSIGFYNNFTSIGGTYKKLNYYGYNRYTIGECWRCNSDFKANNNFVALNFQANANIALGIEYSGMKYLAHQPGGLTDAQFEDNPQQSNRERNWFEVVWNMPVITFDAQLTEKTKLNWRNYSLIGSRDALGNLQAINRADGGGERDYLTDNFYNFGSELRVIHRYNIKHQTANFLIGTRLYRGLTVRRQGLGDDGSEPSFGYNEDGLLSDYRFPNVNWALFSENIFNINHQWSITPGVRLEYINTLAEGYYRNIIKDGAGNVLQDVRIDESKHNNRFIVLAGIGISYKPKTMVELYGNFSQNYRAINFNDIRVINPNAAVDENLKDEKGFNADLGLRGNWKGFRYDFSFFVLKYQDKIGDVFTTVPDPILVERAVRLRTNISDARNIGIELFLETDLLSYSEKASNDLSLVLFTNFSYVNSIYVNSDNSAFDGKKVELVPPYIFRTGLTFGWKGFDAAVQYSYTHQHFTDATNAIETPNAVDGIIPSYYVLDLSLSYEWKWFTFETGINNLTNNHYYTRRASGYPGPGIIPSDGISAYGGVQFNISKTN